MVFTCLEFLHGRYKAGYTHLQNGLKLLSEIQAQFRALDDDIVILRPFNESVDDWLIEAFARLNVQTTLFRHGFVHHYVVQQHSEPELLPPTFQSTHQARQHLDRLLNGIFHLTEQHRQKMTSYDSCLLPGLVDRQRYIQAELASWLQAYKASKASPGARMSTQENIAYRLLGIYHTMAHIMTDTCLRADESAFDCYTHDFVSAMAQSKDLLDISSQAMVADDSSGCCTENFTFIVDMGLIPPLYYAALKCRAPQVRLQAVKMLKMTSHQEGIWDGILAATIVEEVIGLEERDFYKDILRDNNLSLRRTPIEGDLALPVIPECFRMHKVEVELLGDSKEKAILTCRRRQEDGTWELVSREFVYVPGIGYKRK